MNAVDDRDEGRDAPPLLRLPVADEMLAVLGTVTLSGQRHLMLKRAYHVKDSGHLFPGHGGMLDRIDSILFVAPVMWAVRTTFFLR
jgi:CDP-diglyceride synthetase